MCSRTALMQQHPLREDRAACLGWPAGAGPLTAMRNIAQHAACRDPGSSRGPSDLQCDALPTELSRQVHAPFQEELHELDTLADARLPPTACALDACI